ENQCQVKDFSYDFWFLLPLIKPIRVFFSSTLAQSSPLKLLMISGRYIHSIHHEDESRHSGKPSSLYADIQVSEMVADKGKKPEIGEKIVEDNTEQIMSLLYPLQSCRRSKMNLKSDGSSIELPAKGEENKSRNCANNNKQDDWSWSKEAIGE
ncbi:hypothetical protein Ccrd_014332, partial [Cynara cardunculus var. scolymus]